MAEYIDREKTLDTIRKHKWSVINTKEKEKQNMFADEIAFNIYKDIPTADVIERSKIHKAIEEIKKIDLIVHDGINHYYKDGEEVISEVLEILKRNIGA